MQRRATEPPALNGYQFVRLLGSGGFADVFLYDQSFPKRQVAVKVLLLDELTQESRDAFTAEANVMAQLSAHPYIVTIFQAAVAEDDRPYLVMEYCSGPSLAEQFKRQPLSVAQTLELGVRLSSAIATAHAAGILHRDIKPANVLTNQFGWPALTDFGISSTVDELAPTMTTTSRALGGGASTAGGTASVGMSIPWSPPEMFDDVPKPDVRSDVFSLAATLYTVLAGHTPFEVPGRSNGSVDLIGRIARGAVTPLNRADVPASLKAVLQKGMASDPDDRFATAVEFGRALQRVEVELAYQQTPLDIPNLAIARPERSETGDDASADETRARAIPTIHAQSVAPLAPGTPREQLILPAPQADPAPQETVVRERAVQPAPASQEATQLRRPNVVEGATVRRRPPSAVTGREEDSTPAPKGRRRTVLISVLVAVVVIGGVIGASAYLAGSAKQPTASDTQPVGGQGGPPAGEVAAPPQPTGLKGVLAGGGTDVTFTWVDPKSSKNYVDSWSYENSGDDGTPVTRPTATVPFDGSKVCIQVITTNRSTSQASAPTDGCYPQ